MSRTKTLTVEGTEIQIFAQQEEDYICITDIARKFNPVPTDIIKSWMRNRNTVEFLGTWEMLHNPGFNLVEFDQIKMKTGLGSFVLTVKEWTENTNALGLQARAGRYGGTFAHRDIALEFCSYVNPVFKLYFIKEFQRLKESESTQLQLQWNLRRELSKANFYIHTDAVRENLVPTLDWNTKREAILQSSEADLLNLSLFGMTAKEWKLQHPDKKGNMRDHASLEQLLVLANLESLNAEFIRLGYNSDQRVRLLHKAAQTQMDVLARLPPVENIKKLT
jgi:hypothetical protein